MSILAMMYCFNLNLFIKNDNTFEMMYEHMAMSPMDWQAKNMLAMFISLATFFTLYLLFPAQTTYNSRWAVMLNKFSGMNLSLSHKSYMMVMCSGMLIYISNLYSIYSFNWIPSTQSWLIVLITTMFLLSLWLAMLFSGGMKLFGTKVPMSWYMINLSIWLFHNLSFLIRFISLPFRMMMNLIVGCFLVEFIKSLTSGTSMIAIYELFVITVQTLVFLILLNMYYTEMTMLPEWKHSQPTYSFIPQIMKTKPLLHMLKLKIMVSLTRLLN
uniref:ATP synthase F0 subunit 6 n=1 Tax=Trichuris suis TaxID=68888 RepID=H9L846_9BILA|nr:ATP synthase F0 subunit 6 [Trichuris suis]ACY09662.1 ATP synthase F0 subunit 6 [Trichuris suis]